MPRQAGHSAGARVRSAALRAARPAVTTPDLVVLSFLAATPRHGYELWRELERCDVRDWAAISRPQVYYSITKLAGAGYLVPVPDQGSAEGPERTVYRTSAAGRAALAGALAREEWSTQRPPPPFLTWMALSGRVDRAVRREQLERRREFLGRELARERETAAWFDAHAPKSSGAMMVRLAIRQFEVELAWLDEVAETL